MRSTKRVKWEWKTSLFAGQACGRGSGSGPVVYRGSWGTGRTGSWLTGNSLVKYSCTSPPTRTILA